MIDMLGAVGLVGDLGIGGPVVSVVVEELAALGVEAASAFVLSDLLGEAEWTPDFAAGHLNDQLQLVAESGIANARFVEAPWPDFGEENLRAALAEYASRERRFGGR